MTDFKPGDKAMLVGTVIGLNPASREIGVESLSGNVGSFESSDLTPVPSLEDVADVIGRYLYLEVSDMDAADVIAREVMRLFLGDLDAKSPGRTVDAQPASGVGEA